MFQNQDEIPLWRVNIRRNVSQIKRPKTLFETEKPPDLAGQYALEYPLAELQTKGNSQKATKSLLYCRNWIYNFPQKSHSLN